MIAEIKKDLNCALKARDTQTRDILKVLLGEIQTAEMRLGSLSPDKIVKIVEKMVNDNTQIMFMENIAVDTLAKLKNENKILGKYLPQYLTEDIVMGFILNSEGQEFEQIRDCPSDGQAIGVAMKFFKSNDLMVKPLDVKTVVEKIRKEGQSNGCTRGPDEEV